MTTRITLFRSSLCCIAIVLARTFSRAASTSSSRDKILTRSLSDFVESFSFLLAFAISIQCSGIGGLGQTDCQENRHAQIEEF
jgi:hypothetical protein